MASVSFGTTTVTLSGSSRRISRSLRRYIDEHLSPQALARKFLAEFPLHAFRAEVLSQIERTGRLAESLRLVQRGGNVELRGVFYAGFQPHQRRIEAIFMRYAEQTLRGFRRG